MIFKSLLRKKKKIITTNISKDVSSGKYGYLDIVNEHGISGWFLNLDNPEDNEVVIKINGEEIGSIIPNFHRPDIYQLTGKNVKTGFSVNWDLLNLNENLIKEKSWNIELFNKEIPIPGKKKIEGIELEAIKNKIKHDLFSPVTVDFNLADTKDLKMFIDRVEVKNNHINLIGWFYAAELDYCNFKLKHNDAKTTYFLTKYGIKREDVLTTLGEPEALYSGFISEVEVNDKGQYGIVLEVKYKNGKKDEYSLGTVIVRSRYKSNWTHGECENLNIFYENLIDLTLQHKNNIEFLNLVMPEPVDIIIPVFNGFRYLAPLFNSILKNTNEPYNLIIIDDASTDYRVVEYLNKLKETYPGKITLKRNEKNRGFTSSVNEGLRISNNNAVILNTDIEVPPGWLYRLMKPLFENPQISSTTPFTNAGTICSFPEFLKDNKLPADIFSEQIDEIFSGITLNDCLIELPTGIGFCMGLSKKALREVGFFDEKRFPIGYGEENDWCMRAKNRGFVNVIIPNLFVYHKHGGSFTDEQKQKLTERHLKVLNEVFPEYQNLVQDFIKEDPVKPLRNIAGLFVFGKYKETALVIDHSIGGGGNIYRENIIKDRLREDKCVILYTEEYFSFHSKLQCRYENFVFELYMKDSRNLFQLTQELNINEIFLNNLVSYEKPLDILEVIKLIKKNSKSRLIMPVHDYYCICPSYNLLNEKGLYCNVPEDLHICSKCLENNIYSEKPYIKDIVEWRNAWKDVIELTDKILCFSNSSKDILIKAYPSIDKNKILVLPHNLEIVLRKVNVKETGNVVNVAVIGNINYQKGSEVVIELSREILTKKLPIKIHILGNMNIKIPSELKNIIEIHGSYKRENLPDIIERLNIHIVLFPSVWPETFSYVVEEVMMMGMPVIAFNIGAPAERLKNYDKAKLVDIGDIENIITNMLNFDCGI